MLHRLPVAPAQVKAGSTSESLLTENPTKNIFFVSSKWTK